MQEGMEVNGEDACGDRTQSIVYYIRIAEASTNKGRGKR